MLVGVMLRATRQLNLTPEQQTAIKGILSTAHAQHRAAAGTAPVDLLTLANPGDPNYATAPAERQDGGCDPPAERGGVAEPDLQRADSRSEGEAAQVLADMKTKAEARRAAWQQQHGAATTGAAGSN